MFEIILSIICFNLFSRHINKYNLKTKKRRFQAPPEHREEAGNTGHYMLSRLRICIR